MDNTLEKENKAGLSRFTESQRNAVLLRGRDLLVSAGAGTGKTRVLVQRFIQLVLEGGARVDDILTVTFTEKAADEMKRRIASGFEELGMDEEKRAVENAYISTIHGFCSRLLRENPFAAGIDPEFDTLTEVDQAMRMGRAFTQLIEQADEPLMDLIDRLGMECLRGALKDYVELNRSLGRSAERIDRLVREPEVLLEKLYKAVESRVLAFQLRIIDAAGTLEEMTAAGRIEEVRTELLDYVRAMRKNVADSRTLKEIAARLKGEKFTSKKKTGDPNFEAVGGILKNIRDMLKQNDAILKVDPEEEMAEIREMVVPFLKAAESFWRAYDAIKREEGVLDYEDLQLIAKDLLKKNEAVRREYKSKFKHLLVDEFQDINGLQRDILELLKTEGGFFIVGDIRQSIYGFRNADVGIMREYRSRYNQGGGACVELNENFRSDENVLKFINGFFSSLWEGEEGKQPLRHARDEKGHVPDGPTVEIVLFNRRDEESDNDDTSMDDLRDSEAAAVGARVSELVRNGTLVHDPDTDELRPVRYSDIALLFRSRSSYDYYSRAFTERGIPFSLHQGRGYFDQREVKDILAFISLLDNSRRDIDATAVLRSPFFDISDDAFVFIRKHAEENGIKGPYVVESLRGIVDGDLLSDEDKQKAKDFLLLFDRLREVRDLVSPVELFDMMMESTNYEAKVLTLWGGERRLANLRKFRELMDVHSRESHGGISGFIRFYDEVKEWGFPEEIAEQETDEANKVRLMTIHGAKGLEFPVTIIGDLGRRYNVRRPRVMVDRDLEVGFPRAGEDSEKEKDSLRKSLISDDEKKRALEEEERLLYVAMTRARDRLVLAGVIPQKKPSSVSHPIDMVEEHVLCDIDEEGESGPAEKNYRGSKILLHTGPVTTQESVKRPRAFIHTVEKFLKTGKKIPAGIVDGYDEQIEKALRERVEFVRKVEEMEVPRIPDHLAAGDVLLFSDCPRKYYLLKVLDLPDEDLTRPQFQEKAGEGLSGAELGNVVHNCLENIDYMKDPNAEISRVMGALNLPEADEKNVANLLGNVLKSKLADEIRASSEILREVPFTLFVHDIRVRGRADLLYKSEGGEWHLLDYKTDKVDSAGVDEKAEYYRLQMELYGLTLWKAENIIPEDGTTYFLVPNESRSFKYTHDALERCLSRIEDMIGQIKAGGFGAADEERCATCPYMKLYCRHLSGAQ